jgi:hypothetical protein
MEMHATIEKLFKAVFSMQSALRLEKLSNDSQ